MGLEEEELIAEYRMMNIMGKLTGVTYHVLKFIIKSIRPRIGNAMEASRKLTTHGHLEINGRAYELRTFDKNLLLAAYTCQWNILAMTVYSLPITSV